MRLTRASSSAMILPWPMTAEWYSTTARRNPMIWSERVFAQLIKIGGDIDKPRVKIRAQVGDVVLRCHWLYPFADVRAKGEGQYLRVGRQAWVFLLGQYNLVLAELVA